MPVECVVEVCLGGCLVTDALSLDHVISSSRGHSLVKVVYIHVRLQNYVTMSLLQ